MAKEVTIPEVEAYATKHLGWITFGPLWGKMLWNMRANVTLAKDTLQFYINMLGNFTQFLAPLSFMKSGMDIFSELPQAPWQRVFMYAMTDYFSKWIEAGLYKQVTDSEVISFIKCGILCRFGIPSQIICNNESQFRSGKMRKFCQKWKIRLGNLHQDTRKPMGKQNLATKLSSTTSISALKKSGEDGLMSYLWYFDLTEQLLQMQLTKLLIL